MHSLHFSDVNIHFNGDLSGEIVINEAVDNPGDQYERALTSLAEIANAALRGADLTLASEQGKKVIVSAATVRNAVGQWALDKEAEEFEVLEPVDVFSDDHRCARVRRWAADSDRKRRMLDVIRDGIDNYYMSAVDPDVITAGPIVGVVFSTMDADDGQSYHLYEAGCVVFADGSFDSAGFGATLRTLFDDEYSHVNEPFTVAVDLRTGSFDESDDKADVALCQRFGITDPDAHRAAVIQRLRDKRRTR